MTVKKPVQPRVVGTPHYINTVRSRINRNPVRKNSWLRRHTACHLLSNPESVVAQILRDVRLVPISYTGGTSAASRTSSRQYALILIATESGHILYSMYIYEIS